MEQVVAFSGRLGYAGESEARYGEMCQGIAEGARIIVLDLERVPDVDSEGIGFLVTCLSTVQRAGGSLRLAGASEKVRQVLHITRLTTLFPVFPSVEAALSGPPG